jgi:hypothetical protein
VVGALGSEAKLSRLCRLVNAIARLLADGPAFSTPDLWLSPGEAGMNGDHGKLALPSAAE